MAKMDERFQNLDLRMQQLSKNQSHFSRRDENEHEATQIGNSKGDHDLSEIKLKIPPFHGRNDPEAFLDWLYEFEVKFHIRNYSNYVKFGLIISEFKHYAMTW